MSDDNIDCNKDEEPNKLKMPMSPRISLLNIYKSSRDLPFPKAEKVKINFSTGAEDEMALPNIKVSMPHKSRNDFTQIEVRKRPLFCQTIADTKQRVASINSDVKNLDQEISSKYEIIANLMFALENENREYKELHCKLSDISLLKLLRAKSDE